MMDPKKSTDAPAAPRGIAEAGKRAGTTPPDMESEKPVQPSYDWLYDEVLNEPIPDSFVDLLQQLYDRQKKRQN
jgi:hypothetical protein